MYKNGEAAIDRVLVLVAKCPQELQPKCFEILLNGYVQLQVNAAAPPVAGDLNQLQQLHKLQAPPPETDVPAAARTRFANTAKRIDVSLDKLESLFDFGVDPFTLQAVVLPGKNNAEKAREVALLAASRSYLATGSWSADWSEVKALCVDHNCYDKKNQLVNLKAGVNKNLFKAVELGGTIELAVNGVKKAEQLLKHLATGNSE